MNANPVVSEILAGALRAIEEEVEELLARVWRSPSLRDAGDFSVCLFDRFGRALTGRALASGPVPVLRAHPEIAEGDVFLHNDPYAPPAGLGEAPELCLTRPLFADGALLAFLQIRGRHDDVGGALPGGGSGGARESYHEGLLVPPVRIARGDETVRDVKTLLLRNSRQAHHLGDDIDAQLGALRVGAARLGDLTRRYGAENLSACFADLLRECELAFRERLIPRIPEKSWTARSAVESDGLGGPHSIELTLARRGDALRVALDAAPQARGPINCPLEGEGAQCLLRLLAPVLLHLAEDAAEFPLNDGALRAFEVELPGRGTLLTPRFPAPTGLRTLTLGKLLSAFGEALFEASGGRAPAGSESFRTLAFWGYDEGGGFHLLREALGAGAGADAGGDGASASPPVGGAGGMSVEMMEARYPVRVESMGLVEDSGGAGENRGGLGVYREYRLLMDGEAASAAGGAEARPPGRAGGSAGKPYRLERRAGRERVPMPAVCASVPFSGGDAIRVSTPGGGGWGDPMKRDPRAARADVLRGFVSREAAESLYGVVLGRAPGFKIDESETRERRRGK